MFWLQHEILRRPSLLADLRAECIQHLTSDTSLDEPVRFNTSGLRSQPLLQSSIAEILRLRTHVFIMRYPDQHDMDIGEWRIPKESLVMACSTTSHMDPSLWNTTLPLTAFWAERFLEQPKSCEKHKTAKHKPRFSSRGLDGVWLPFGGGAQMCPGQQFSRTAISLVPALMITLFDVELCCPGKKLPVSWSHFGAGVIRPGAKVPFRIRKRVGVFPAPAVSR